jgi:hypothetical protein
LTTKTTNVPIGKTSANAQTEINRVSFPQIAIVFISSYLVLFFGMSLRPNIFDEGIVLTGAMRVLSGQIPHQDFYANYGPGQFYALAGLFKLLGESVLVERLYDLFLRALIVTLVYAITSSYCRKSISIGTTVVMVLWFFGLSLQSATAGTALIPVSLLNLVASILLVPIFVRPMPAWRMFAAGAAAGMATLFRYDTGVALLGVQACVVAIAICLRIKDFRGRIRSFASTFWLGLSGFAAVTLPAFLYYLSRAPLYPFVHDILIYPRKYYYRGRNVPFPGIHLKALDNIGIYLPVFIIGISLYVALARGFQVRNDEVSLSQEDFDKKKWNGFLITFGILALAMYFKGFVRVSLVHMYLSILPSLLLIAILFQHRLTMGRYIRSAITALACLSVLAAGLFSLRAARDIFIKHVPVPESIWSPSKGSLPGAQATWCKMPNPVTKGFCFLPDDDHIQAIEFIASHTQPGEKLFVGQTRHDIVYANDNLIYYATQRLPATKWSQFDPDLINRYDIQTQIVKDLETTAPPYIVLDSEFDLMHEPNDSSKSSGVMLLDDYIHQKYRLVETFGEMSILKRS